MAVLACGHVVMLRLMHVLLELFEPAPNGFRFDTFPKVASFAVVTLAPVLVGLGARRWPATAAVGLLQALSPLMLLGSMRDPSSDLNFAVLLWWFPLPALAVTIVMVDRWADHRLGHQSQPVRP